MNESFQFLIYRSAEQDVSVNAIIRNETIWLTQKAMAELFGVEVPAVSKHLANIFAEGELEAAATVSKMETVQQEGVRKVKRSLDFYNLDAIISVGYRVNSRRATHFRIWATGVLKEYMTKGFALDDERLKQGRTAFGRDYFRELLEHVRSIRASERRIWQQITDIFAECSLDGALETAKFFCFSISEAQKRLAEIREAVSHWRQDAALTQAPPAEIRFMRDAFEYL